MNLEPADIQAHFDRLAKPPGSLGRLETLSARLCSIQQTLAPVTRPRQLTLFAADHGAVASGVSAWPRSVTRLMVNTIAGGGAASSVLCRSTQTALRLVDVGVMDDDHIEPSELYRACPVARGTRDLSREPAMTLEQAETALAIGREEAIRALGAGNRVLIAGEMGIGNSTSAACLTVALANVPVEEAVGRGAGADDTTLARKRDVVARAVARLERSGTPRSPRAVAAEVGGFEILAMAGYYLAGARGGATLLLDGYIATAAALIANAIEPATTSRMIAAHASAEPGHRASLASLGLSPMLDWQLRLGEGTGALLLLPLLDAAAEISSSMACLQDLLGEP